MIIFHERMLYGPMRKAEKIFYPKKRDEAGCDVRKSRCVANFYSGVNIAVRYWKSNS